MIMLFTTMSSICLQKIKELHKKLGIDQEEDMELYREGCTTDDEYLQALYELEDFEKYLFTIGFSRTAE